MKRHRLIYRSQTLMAASCVSVALWIWQHQYRVAVVWKKFRQESISTLTRSSVWKNSAINDEEMEDIDYLIGFDLDVDKLIYGEILVNWPMKVLCKEDCKGICKVCGMNLNKGNCDCQRTELDPRMAAIQDVFNKFKEV